jgi:hypothetical protein
MRARVVRRSRGGRGAETSAAEWPYVLFMSDPLNQDVKERPHRAGGFGAGFQAPLVPQGTADPADGDQRAARMLVLATIAGAFVVGGGIEWFGWQIVYRHADPATVLPPDLLGVPRARWALGTILNAAGALGLGIGTSALAMLFPWSRKRPWRAAAAAFAIGTATMLTVLGALTSLAP